MTARVWFGLLAALGACGVAGDAFLAKSEYPLMHKLFNGDWNIARNFLYFICSTMAASFGFLALNYKEKTNGKTQT